MSYILFLSLFFLILTSLVLWRNRFEFRSLASISHSDDPVFPKISICIPARNEEKVIERCVRSALQQNYPSFELLVLDDRSTDQTSLILTELQASSVRLKIINGVEKPDDWLGKPWACHHLAQQATGDLLLFIDADVWLEPETLRNLAEQMKTTDALTVWPNQKVVGFWEELIVPTIYFALLTMLPAIYVERAPRWMPAFLKPLLAPKFVAACGQFIAFHRKTYETIGGHESVKDQVVEDMELARRLKNGDHKLTMRNGIGAVHCRMYTSGSEIWHGFQKNFLAGFGNIFEFIFMGVVHFLVFLFPFWTLFKGISKEQSGLIILSIAVIIIPILQRFTLHTWFGWNKKVAFLHALSVGWFQLLALKSLMNRIFNIKTTWKGRQV